MTKVFEDEFVEVQAGLISLCLEFAGRARKNVDWVYAYCYLEYGDTSFNAFYECDGELLRADQLGLGMLTLDFLKIGMEDLQEIRKVCNNHDQPIPTEMRLVYSPKTNRFQADISYDVICPLYGDLECGELYDAWFEEEKKKLAAR